jgi:hypothetical protein
MCVDTKRNQIGRVLWMLSAGLMAAGLLAAELHAQDFTLSQNGKSVGKANLSLKQTSGGLEEKSEAKIDMPGLKYDISEHEMLNSHFHLAQADLKGSVNGTSATVSALPDGQQIVMKISANGKVINTPLESHPSSIFFPDFDPGALQILLNLGALHNNAGIWAMIPKQSGSVAALRIATNADMTGTLEGRPITVHHLTVTGTNSKTELFSGPSNELLQAEWSDEGFAMVRNGFKLTPPTRPGAPPPAPAQPAAQPSQPQAQPPQAQQQ